ncbi:hypothetical protein PIB30_032080 [Stylosanthes scabra]|uniref:Uncharacterized protein n=1 Tax=Stylosanthes scabra TaxID=79078 RepID=A0ABU6SC54_9FABA|nr:hypothetical protein [Stylosanthes scabra]
MFKLEAGTTEFKDKMDRWKNKMKNTKFMSFSTLHSASPSTSSSDSSSDQSIGFFHENVTFGGLIGVSSNVLKKKTTTTRKKMEMKASSSLWLLLLCVRPRSSYYAKNNKATIPLSLGQYLALERRHKQMSLVYGFRHEDDDDQGKNPHRNRINKKPWQGKNYWFPSIAKLFSCFSNVQGN